MLIGSSQAPSMSAPRLATVSLLLAKRTGYAAPKPRKISPSEKLNIAGVGVGGKGQSDSADAGRSGKVVAVADVDSNQLKRAEAAFEGTKTYTDFRKMFDEMHAGIDAVIVSTPDHTHFPAAALAMDAGLHVYCEKPLAHTVTEARILNNLAKAKKRVTQMGTQVHAENNYRRVVELIRAGAIVRVVQAIRDGDRWEFCSAGEALGFEERDLYTRRVKKDRLPLELLVRYFKCCSGFDLSDQNTFRSERELLQLVERRR